MLKGDSYGKTLNNINVILVMLKDKEFVGFFSVSSLRSNSALQPVTNDDVGVEAQWCCYHQGSSLLFG